MDNINISSIRFVEQLNLYQAANSDDASIKKNFVVRKLEFQLIIDSLLYKKEGDSLQHELILGSRGGGKSTLLKRIQIEIVENEKLNKKFIAINLPEEQAGIYTLADLWLEVIKELNYTFKANILIESFSVFANSNEYMVYLYKLIHEFCATKKKKLVLLLDNFDRIVENFTDDGKLLREQLINFNDIAIIAGSTRMDEHFWRYDKPFYEFFRRHKLEKLSIEEVKALITHWAETLEIEPLKEFVKNNNGKIENIRLLTDGLPRTLQFFIQILLQHTNEYGYTYLKKIMDGVSPLFQERLNMLPAQLRKIIYEMAFIWEACNTKQLADACMMPSKLISANLKTLNDKGIVETITTKNKNNLYRIKERFFNMWIIVTQGNPNQKRKAKWLSIFLENWYNEHDLKRIATEHIKALKNEDKKIEDVLLYSKAISQCRTTSLNERDTIIQLTKQLANSNENNLINELPEESSSIINAINKMIENKEYEKALKATLEIENESDGSKFGILGFLYENQKEYTKSEKYYLLAIEKGNINAIFNLALFYDNQEKYTKAEKYYLLDIERGNINALNNLGNLYYNQEKNIDAEKYYLQAIEKGAMYALNNLGALYHNQEKYADAEKYYLKAIKKDDINALLNLGFLYEDQKKYANAEKYYLLAIENGVSEAAYYLAVMNYHLNTNKTKTLNLIGNDDTKNLNGFRLIIEVWNGVFNNLEKRAILAVENEQEYQYGFLFDLLVHQQKALVLKLFTNERIGNSLQEKHSVLYYVTLILNNQTQENLLLKIPPEILTTIASVQNKIAERQKFYGYF